MILPSNTEVSTMVDSDDKIVVDTASMHPHYRSRVQHYADKIIRRFRSEATLSTSYSCGSRSINGGLLVSVDLRFTWVISTQRRYTVQNDATLVDLPDMPEVKFGDQAERLGIADELIAPSRRIFKERDSWDVALRAFSFALARDQINTESHIMFLRKLEEDRAVGLVSRAIENFARDRVYKLMTYLGPIDPQIVHHLVDEYTCTKVHSS